MNGKKSAYMYHWQEKHESSSLFFAQNQYWTHKNQEYYHLYNRDEQQKLEYFLF